MTATLQRASFWAKVLGWLWAIPAVVFAGLTLQVMLNRSELNLSIVPEGNGMLVTAFAALVAWGCFHSATNLHEARWRTVCALIGALSLLAFPIGTVVGVGVLSNLWASSRAESN